MSYTETCHCGHDKSSHYFDRSVQPWRPLSCLGSGCSCPAYVHESEPKPKVKLVRPAHISTCQCYRCKEWAKSVAEIQQRIDDRPTKPGLGDP